ncbi:MULTISPECIES: DUF6293 family protein [Halorussus]|uniref:HFX_2341 family transcriptional regulator domain-containing protein n=1 Tax=Halorussus TaxID=1070314 RepID=UPI00209EB647|nr:DUF6293 family protein [Halorussus vallis]USZ78038.1 DUF6293 family protein [Halorussus vallis]
MQSPPPVAERVQVVPLGFEYARLRDPVMEWKADKVVAVEYAESDADPSYLAAFLAELEANERIELERRACDIFDLYDTLGTVAGAIHDHADDDVYVNLSGGSKITAVAGMIACMATGATPIYAKPDYGPDAERIPPEPLHDAVEETFALPTYPVERPSATHVAFLRFVGERTCRADEADGTGGNDGTGGTAEPHGRYRGASKKELIEFAREEGFPFVVESSAETEKGYYRLLDTHVVDPLTAKGYVETEKVGRRKYLTLTEAGENALRAFRHLI